MGLKNQSDLSIFAFSRSPLGHRLRITCSWLMVLPSPLPVSLPPLLRIGVGFLWPGSPRQTPEVSCRKSGRVRGVFRVERRPRGGRTFRKGRRYLVTQPEGMLHVCFVFHSYRQASVIIHGRLSRYAIRKFFFSKGVFGRVCIGPRGIGGAISGITEVSGTSGDLVPNLTGVLR